MSSVRIPPVLRTQADGQKEVTANGATVGELLTNLVASYPGLGDQLFAGDGSLHRFVNVYLNGQDVRYMDELGTPVKDNDAVIILPAMAGGSVSA